MSNTDNHKKAIKITASCYGIKGLMTKIYYKILEDHPAAIVNAAEALRKVAPHGSSGVSPGYGPWHKNDLWQCPDCKKFVSKLGIAGACIKCDPRGFDVPY